MNPPVKKAEKKLFLKWFLEKFKMKKMESKWILIYLMHHEDLLQYVHFVRDASFCPRSITIATDEVEQESFRFYKDHIETQNIDKAFHDIRLNPFEPLYIQLYFPNWKQEHRYATVLEENPFISSESSLTKDDRIYSEKILKYSIISYEKKQLLIAIDQALDEKNEEKFLELSKKLTTIDE